MRALLVIALAGCNRIFGVADVVALDGAILDAPEQCPAIGSLPMYARGLTQYLAQNCDAFQIDATGRSAIAHCYDDVHYEGTLFEGPVAGPLAIAQTDVIMWPSVPRLDPNGELVYGVDGNTNDIFALQRDGNGAWQHAGSFTTGISFPQISTIARVGSETRMLVADGTTKLHEWAAADGVTWADTGAVYQGTDLGLLAIGQANLSSDGLRLIARGIVLGTSEQGMIYADRASIAEPFARAQTFAIPPVPDAFITPDCTRVYFSGLDRVFFVAREH